jgi:hypothetical protein
LAAQATAVGAALGPRRRPGERRGCGDAYASCSVARCLLVRLLAAGGGRGASGGTAQQGEPPWRRVAAHRSGAPGRSHPRPGGKAASWCGARMPGARTTGRACGQRPSLVLGGWQPASAAPGRLAAAPGPGRRPAALSSGAATDRARAEGSGERTVQEGGVQPAAPPAAHRGSRCAARAVTMPPRWVVAVCSRRRRAAAAPGCVAAAVAVAAAAPPQPAEKRAAVAARRQRRVWACRGRPADQDSRRRQTPPLRNWSPAQLQRLSTAPRAWQPGFALIAEAPGRRGARGGASPAPGGCRAAGGYGRPPAAAGQRARAARIALVALAI